MNWVSSDRIKPPPVTAAAKKYKKSKSSQNLFDQNVGLKAKNLRRRQSMQSSSNVLHSRKNNIANVTKLPNKKVAAANRDGTKKYGILLRSRVDILCCKFIENIKNRIYEKKGIKIGGDKKLQKNKISFFTEMINFR